MSKLQVKVLEINNNIEILGTKQAIIIDFREFITSKSKIKGILKDEAIYKNPCKNKHSELEREVDRFGGIALYAHPFYEWVDINIDKINNNLLYAVMSNIVPLGNDGRKYFINIAEKREDSFIELMKLYESIKKVLNDPYFRISTYSELYNLGYTGVALEGYCPAYDVFKFKFGQ